MPNETLPAPQRGSSNALPLPWVDKLFERLAALYGRHWLDLWADVPMADVKDAWREALAGLTGEQIRRGLEHLAAGGTATPKANPAFPPTAPEFGMLCRTCRVEPAHQHFKALPRPRGEIPAHVAEFIHAFVESKRVQQ